MPKPGKHVLVCVQSRPPGHPRGSCGEKGCAQVYQRFMDEFQARNLWADCLLTNTGCLGPCSDGPTVLVYPDSVMYNGVGPDDVAELIETHLIGGQPVERLLAAPGVWD
ncbi:MAG: (2Fe-2S) ferredoxin domain-containing protein [Rhodocyclaceae bacterium]|nr:(2Fe-2S) ferredoxin domain-containing protein [Rhodocyclaceae bacterium]